MKTKLFETMIQFLSVSKKTTRPLATGFTFLYRKRPVLDSVKLDITKDRLSGYIKLHNLKELEIDLIEELAIQENQITKSGNAKIHSLSDTQITKLTRFIESLTLLNA